MPIITVLMSVYNGERYLHEAVDSILKQTFTDFEFLIINDSSTDSSREIILSYNDPRIRLIENQTNIGLTKSLNLGLELAKGRLIARQDADDISHPTRLQEQVSFLDHNPEIVVLGTQVRIVDENLKPMYSIPILKATTSLNLNWQIMFDSPFIHSSVMFRRNIIWEKLGGYDASFITSQDFELWSRVAREHKALSLEHVLVDFRCHSGSVSVSYHKDMIQKVKDVLDRNITSRLKTDTSPDGWLDFWVAVNNPKVYGEAKNIGKMIKTLKAIYSQFISLNPAAVSDKGIKRHLADILIRIACNAARYDKKNSLIAYINACKVDIVSAKAVLFKYPLLLLFSGFFHKSLRRFVR